MDWHCSTCGGIVGDDDMVGYFTDKQGRYIPGSLGFWHNNPQCGCENDHNLGIRLPKDTHIRDFKNHMFSLIARYIYEAKTEEFRKDCVAFLLRCSINGYEDALPYIKEAKMSGAIDSNLPDNLLWENEVQEILRLKNNNCL